MRGLFGVIDICGNFLLPLEYEFILYLEPNGYFEVKKDNKFGVVDIKNNIILPIQYENITFVWGLINKFQFEDGDYDLVKEKGLLILTLDSKSCIFDLDTLKFITGFDYDSIRYFYDDEEFILQKGNLYEHKSFETVCNLDFG